MSSTYIFKGRTAGFFLFYSPPPPPPRRETLPFFLLFPLDAGRRQKGCSGIRFPESLKIIYFFFSSFFFFFSLSFEVISPPPSFDAGRRTKKKKKKKKQKKKNPKNNNPPTPPPPFLVWFFFVGWFPSLPLFLPFFPTADTVKRWEEYGLQHCGRCFFLSHPRHFLPFLPPWHRQRFFRLSRNPKNQGICISTPSAFSPPSSPTRVQCLFFPLSPLRFLYKPAARDTSLE